MEPGETLVERFLVPLALSGGVDSDLRRFRRRDHCGWRIPTSAGLVLDPDGAVTEGIHGALQTWPITVDTRCIRNRAQNVMDHLRRPLAASAVAVTFGVQFARPPQRTITVAPSQDTTGVIP